MCEGGPLADTGEYRLTGYMTDEDRKTKTKNIVRPSKGWVTERKREYTRNVINLGHVCFLCPSDMLITSMRTSRKMPGRLFLKVGR